MTCPGRGGRGPGTEGEGEGGRGNQMGGGGGGETWYRRRSYFLLDTCTGAKVYLTSPGPSEIGRNSFISQPILKPLTSVDSS